MEPSSAAESLALARKHLSRVQSSWDPPEWLDLSAYGLYALEAAVVAAAAFKNHELQRNHWSKVESARVLAEQHDLPDVSSLMKELNEIRKSEAYGDVTVETDLDPEELATAVEEYVDAVETLIHDVGEAK
jgi:hypothetical protein